MIVIYYQYIVLILTQFQIFNETYNNNFSNITFDS